MTDDAIEEVARLMFEREPKHQGDTARPRWSWDEIEEESRQYWRNFAKITRNIFARPPLSASEPAGAPSEEDDPRITGTLRVGYVRFHPGVKTSTVQHAIDRALFDRS